MSNLVRDWLKTYTTPRLLQADNTRLQLCYLAQLGIIIILFALYAMVYHQAHQQRCPVRGVTTVQTFGGFYMPKESAGLAEEYPTVFQNFWSASDVIQPFSNGFTVLSNIVVTPNQTQTTCPESPNVHRSICSMDENNKDSGFNFTNCKSGAQSVSGLMTGNCVYNSMETLTFYDLKWGEPGTSTCEVESWCPLLPVSSGKPYGNSAQGAVLEYSKNLIVLLRTSADFPLCGDTFFGVQDLSEGKPRCSYHPVLNPSCPWFTLHDLVLYGGFISYNNVALTGQVFRITIKWQCDFDWTENCIPLYSISPVFAQDELWGSYYWEQPIYNGKGVRTLVRKFGLKFIIEHEGEGKKTTLWLLMKTFSLGFPYLFIPGFVITLLYNKFFKNYHEFKRKKYLEFRDDEDTIVLTPTFLDTDDLRTKLV